MFPGSLDIFNAHVAQYLQARDIIFLNKDHYINAFERSWPIHGKHVVDMWAKNYVLYSLKLITESRLDGRLTITNNELNTDNNYVADQMIPTFNVSGLSDDVRFLRSVGYPSKFIDASNIEICIQKVFEDKTRFNALIDYPETLSIERVRYFIDVGHYHDKILKVSTFDDIILNNFDVLAPLFYTSAHFKNAALFSKKYTVDHTNVCINIVKYSTCSPILLYVILEYNTADLNHGIIYDHIIKNGTRTMAKYLMSKIDKERYETYARPIIYANIVNYMHQDIVHNIKLCIDTLIVPDDMIETIKTFKLEDYMNYLLDSDLIFPEHFYMFVLERYGTKYFRAILKKTDMDIPEFIESMIIKEYISGNRDSMFAALEAKKMTPRLREAYMSLLN